MNQLQFWESENFDSFCAELRKLEGIELAQSSEVKKALLAHGRQLARMIARSRPNRLCSIDDVMRAFKKLGVHPSMLGKAAGAVFKTGEWEFVTYTDSKRISNHARPIRVWRLRDEVQ